MSLRSRLLTLKLRLFDKPMLAASQHPTELRPIFERQARRWFRAPKGSRFDWDALEFQGRTLPVLWAKAQGADAGRGVILYLHGGAYVMGSPNTHRAMLAHLSARTGLAACLPRYPLAPEHPFPAAIDHAFSVYEALLAAGFVPQKIVLGGDSAGGGLALAVLGQILARGLPKPAGLFAFSPWTDMEFSGASFRRNALSDPLLPAQRAKDVRAFYLGPHPPDDPRASPLYAQFQGAGPVFLTASHSEILADDTSRMAARLEEQGVLVQCKMVQDLPHAWPIFQGLIPEAGTTLDKVTLWLRGVI